MNMRGGRMLVVLALCGALMLSCVGTVSARVTDVAEKYSKGETIKIACIGDSVTYGVGGTPYPQQLQTMLGNKYEVKNFGISGTTAQNNGHDNTVNEGHLFGYRTANPDPNDWNYDAVYRTVIAGASGKTVYEQSQMYEADIYIIAIGGNDAKTVNWNNGNNQFEEDYRALIQEYLDLPNHPMVIIGTSPAMVKGSYNINIDAVTNTIVPTQRRVAQEMGLMLVETFNPTLDESYFIDDGVHLNTAGYRVVAQQYADAISAMAQTFSSAELTSFVAGETMGVIDNKTDSVYLWLPEETDLTTLTATATVGVVTQEVTDLTIDAPVTFTATSADGTATREYAVYISVGTRKATELELAALPDKTVYDRGEQEMDLTGGKVKVMFDDGSEMLCDLRAPLVSGFESDATGTKTITVSLYGLTTTFEVTVREPVALKLTPPNKVVYMQGEALNMAGAKMTLVYNDGSESLKGGAAVITGYDPQTIGKQTVTLTFQGVSATFEVTVKMLGDVDGNGKVNTVDARLALQYAADRIDETGLDTSMADVDGNEKINTVDARLILQRAAGRIDTFPAEEK